MFFCATIHRFIFIQATFSRFGLTGAKQIPIQKISTAASNYEVTQSSLAPWQTSTGTFYHFLPALPSIPFCLALSGSIYLQYLEQRVAASPCCSGPCVRRSLPPYRLFASFSSAVPFILRKTSVEEGENGGCSGRVCY